MVGKISFMEKWQKDDLFFMGQIPPMKEDMSLSVMDMMVRDCIILIGAGRAGMTTTSLSPCLIHTKLKI